MHVLEIHYHVFKNFTPQQILTPDQQEMLAIEQLKAKERALLNHKNLVRGLRHGKFGTQLEIKREDGSSKMVTNIYQKQIDINDFGNKIKSAPKRSTKDENRAIVAQELLIGDATKDEQDHELLRVLHVHLLDLIENSYN